MRSVQAGLSFPLASVKPLDGLLAYRDYCLSATRAAMAEGTTRRERCLACGDPLEPFGDVGGLAYARCPACESLFLADMPCAPQWGRLLRDVARYRHSPQAFHPGIAKSRRETVYAPKIDWLQGTLRLQGLHDPRVLEVTTPPSDFSELLAASGAVRDVVPADEMALMAEGGRAAEGRVEVAVLLEALDRVPDPAALLRAARDRLAAGGLVFVTGLVASGFDMLVLGLQNLYLCPPDRANCFSLRGLETLLTGVGLSLVEVSTPGVLDVEIVQTHLRYLPSFELSRFERKLLADDAETHAAFGAFLQQRGLSSFARLVGRKVA